MNLPILVFMAGGRGERFWPRSRRRCPKQLLPFTGELSLLQESVVRVRELTEDNRIYIVTHCEQADEVYRQLPFLTARNILIEPEGRNTAPCVGLAAIYVAKHFQDEDPVMAFLPSDSMVFNPAEMRRVLRAGFAISDRDQTGVIYGIWPNRPETGFGYIQLGSESGHFEGVTYHRVAAFIEKPNLETATQYLTSKEYLWNGGIFIWNLRILLREIQEHLPQLAQGLAEFQSFIGTTEEVKKLAAIYPRLPSISVDYGILEKTQKLVVIPTEDGWDDLGSWSALERYFEKDETGNVVQGEYIGVETNNCIIYSPTRVVTTLGVSDLIIVETDDVLLVCKKERAQEIKRLLAKLASLNRAELL